MMRTTFSALFIVSIASLSGALLAPGEAAAQVGLTQPASIVHKVRGATERLEMTVNTSRILSLDLQIPRVVVANPDVIVATPLSPTQIQISAAKAGVTQVNLWDESNQIHAIDVVVYGDTRELTMLLSSEFPNASLKVKPVANGVLISGFVDQPEHVSSIVQIAEEFYPKVLTNMQVGGVHEVLLHVKVMEVSRTKMRALGMDWGALTSSTQFISKGAELIGVMEEGIRPISPATTIEFVINGSDTTFFGVLEAMCENDLAKVLAEPTLIAVSGRPAYFLAGGQVPVESGGGLGVPTSIEYKDYGTQVDFVPIVLGNGRIRLEVRPRISAVDESLAFGNAPAFKVREIDTGVELQAGQTLAIAGLLQTVTEAEKKGIPWARDLPYVGPLFGRVEERQNEVELLVLVTPELISPMDPHEVPTMGPGMHTTSPTDWELYAKGYMEVPLGCACGGAGCPHCLSGGSAYGPAMMPQETVVPQGVMEQVPPSAVPHHAPQAIPAPQPPAAPSLNSGASQTRMSPVVQPVSHPTGSRPVLPPSAAITPIGANPAAASPVRPLPNAPLPGFKGPVGYDSQS